MKTTPTPHDAIFKQFLTHQQTAPETFLWELAQRSPQHKELLMTIAQKLEKKGHMEGKMETTLKIASAMLVNGVARSIIMKTTGLSDKELAQICH